MGKCWHLLIWRECGWLQCSWPSNGQGCEEWQALMTAVANDCTIWLRDNCLERSWVLDPQPAPWAKTAWGFRDIKPPPMLMTGLSRISIPCWSMLKQPPCTSSLNFLWRPGCQSPKVASDAPCSQRCQQCQQYQQCLYMSAECAASWSSCPAPAGAGLGVRWPWLAFTKAGTNSGPQTSEALSGECHLLGKMSTLDGASVKKIVTRRVMHKSAEHWRKPNATKRDEICGFKLVSSAPILIHIPPYPTISHHIPPYPMSRKAPQNMWSLPHLQPWLLPAYVADPSEDHHISRCIWGSIHSLGMESGQVSDDYWCSICWQCLSTWSWKN